MSEGEVVSELVEFTNILLAGVSVFFTVISAYIAALNYFIAAAGWMARLFAFLFVSLILAMLMAVLFGARQVHNGLTERLAELNAAGELSAAGAAVYGNAARRFEAFQGLQLSVDEAVLIGVCAAAGFVYLALAFLTFVYRWRPEPSSHTLST